MDYLQFIANFATKLKRNISDRMTGCLIIILIIVFILLVDYAPIPMAIIVITLVLIGIVYSIKYGVTHNIDGSKKVDIEKEPVPSDIDQTSDSSDNNVETIKDTEPIVVKLSMIQFQGIQNSISKGKIFCKNLSEDSNLRNKFLKLAVNSSTYKTYSKDDFYATLRFLFAEDLFSCFKHLGHNFEEIAKTEGVALIDYRKPEGQALFATLCSLSDNNLDFKSFQEGILSLNQSSGSHYDKEIRVTIEKTLPVYLNSGASISAYGVDDFNMVILLNSLYKQELIPDIRHILYDFSNVIAFADNHISAEEQIWLSELKDKSLVAATSKQDKTKDITFVDKNLSEDNVMDNRPNVNEHPSPMQQLNELIGLQKVKSDLQSLVQFIEVNQKRREAGLRVAAISYHCVFTGNPGTGKTTVARILAGIYKQLGIVQKGQLVETDRSGLVAEYVGQTAVKTNKIIDKAIGGVLFIDEAYTLAQGGENDYGREAIATLLKRMEDDRDRLVVILAGYTNEIEQFIESNPGLRSRFNRYIHFEDYSAEELYDIFKLQAKKYDYILDEDAGNALLSLLKTKVSNKQKDFGNARYVRNLFESVIERQASRLSGSKNVDKNNLAIITKEDIYDL